MVKRRRQRKQASDQHPLPFEGLPELVARLRERGAVAWSLLPNPNQLALQLAAASGHHGV